MRKAIGTLCSVALLAGGGPAAAIQSDDLPRTPPAERMGYCHAPAALPDLGEEVEREQQQRPSPVARTTADSAEKAMAVADSPYSSPPPPPPPIAAPPAAASDAASETVVVTGSRVRGETTADAARSTMPSYPPRPGPPPMPRPSPQPEPQSGMLTAGEHDDLLNPELYADYVRKSDLGQKIADLPRLDTARKLAVEVVDARGQPMPFVPIELRCSDGNMITLPSVADGSAVFFPDLDRLSDTVWVRAAGSEWRPVAVPRGSGSQDVRITADSRAAAVRKLDLALVVDVTGSMSDELRYLQAELRSIMASLEDRHPELDIRVGFTFYRDEGDQFVTRTMGFEGDMETAQKHLARQRADGGGDYEEAMQDALIRAADQEWRDDAVKTLLLVADAPPHDRDIATTWLAAKHLRHERVHIVPVGASGVAETAEYVMRAMAAATQSRYTFLTDDSGIGNPHAPPAIDCYLVTRLDQLLRRVIDSQISGRRIEPERNEVIRTVGQYDAGRCVLPADFGEGSRS